MPRNPTFTDDLNGLKINNKIEEKVDIKVEAFRKTVRKTLPHKHHNYFELIFLTKGSGNHQIDLQNFEIHAPILFVVRKDQVHHWNLQSEPEGFVVIIKNSFIQKSMDQALKLLFTKLSKTNCIQVPKSFSLTPIFDLMCYENKSNNNFTIQEGLLKALFAKIAELEPKRQSQLRTSGLFSAFQEVLSSNEPRRNSVAYYAEKLHTTPQNLNAACQKAANQSAGDVLKEFLLIEAKRLLIYTAKSSAEIAYELGFSDPSHFIKYFKKSCNLTPQQFRIAAST